jgi:hypothetical protein
MALTAIAKPPISRHGRAVTLRAAGIDRVPPFRQANERPDRDHRHESGDDKREEQGRRHA